MLRAPFALSIISLLNQPVDESFAAAQTFVTLLQTFPTSCCAKPESGFASYPRDPVSISHSLAKLSARFGRVS